MSNDPRDHGGEKLSQALVLLSRNKVVKEKLIKLLIESESNIKYSASIRDDITGPIIDALHDERDIYEKILADGTKFQFLYRTKIARDFLLSAEDNPSHVWEPQTTRLLQYLVKKGKGDTLVGGAYFGDHAILLARATSAEDRRVHCFEPNKDQSSMLSINAKLNNLTNIVLSKFGLWDQSSKKLALTGFDSFANAVEINSLDEGFETITIDDYLAKVGRNIGLIMLDIEGAEIKALKGAEKTIQIDQPSIVFEVHRDYVDWSVGLLKTPICEYISNFGYTLFAVRDFNTHQEMGDRPIELIPADAIYLDGPSHGFNMLAIKSMDIIDDKLFKIVKDVSPKLLKHKNPALHHPLDGMPL